jgi:hypothetical protein
MSELKNRYYKGTRKGGVSFHDSAFVYHLGLNEQLNPDKSSAICSQGIHLAKDMQSLKRLCPDAEEIYEARAGVILSEDEEKIRVAYCFLIKQIDKPPDFLGSGPIPICGFDWLNKHEKEFTQADYEALGMTVKTDNHTLTIKAGINPRNLKTALSAIKRG